MLNDRERRALAHIEQELLRSDPHLERLFARQVPPRVSPPAVLLALGLIVMVVGSAMVSVVIAMLGIGIAAVAIVAAYHYRPLGRSSGVT